MHLHTGYLVRGLPPGWRSLRH